MPRILSRMRAIRRDVGEQPLQSGPIRGRTGEPAIVIVFETGTPNLRVLGSQASRCACSELNSLLEPLVGGFAGVDRAADPFLPA